MTERTGQCCDCGEPVKVPDGGYAEILEMARLMQAFLEKHGGRVPVICTECEEREVEKQRREMTKIDGDELIERANIPATMPEGGMGDVFGKLLNDELEKRGVFLAGETGLGKTKAACSLIRAWCREKGRPALYRTEPEIFRRLQEFKDGKADTESRRLRTVGLLVIDDLGASFDNKSGWRGEKLFDLIDSRYQNQELRTVIISNTSLEALVANKEITYIDERIKRRIQEICVVADVSTPPKPKQPRQEELHP